MMKIFEINEYLTDIHKQDKKNLILDKIMLFEFIFN